MKTNQIDKFVGRKVKITLKDGSGCIACLQRRKGSSRLNGTLFGSDATPYEIGMLYCDDIEKIEDLLPAKRED